LLLSTVLQPYDAAPLLLGTQRPPLSIDIFCLHGAQQQTHHMQWMWSNDGPDKRTEA